MRPAISHFWRPVNFVLGGFGFDTTMWPAPTASVSRQDSDGNAPCAIVGMPSDASQIRSVDAGISAVTSSDPSDDAAFAEIFGVPRDDLRRRWPAPPVRIAV